MAWSMSGSAWSESIFLPGSGFVSKPIRNRTLPELLLFKLSYFTLPQLIAPDTFFKLKSWNNDIIVFRFLDTLIWTYVTCLRYTSQESERFSPDSVNSCFLLTLSWLLRIPRGDDRLGNDGGSANMRVRRRTVRTLHQSWTLRTFQSLRWGLCRLKGQ
jgi:hypothetical protein